MSQRPSPALADLQMPVELTRARVSPSRWPWLPLALLGLLICISEIAFLTQDVWLARAEVRALLDPLLDRAGYRLKRPRLSDAWQVESFSLTAIPDREATWRVSAVLVQRADILQAWPHLQLKLRDWQGSSVAQRDLTPAEYLPADLPHPFAPGQLAAPEQAVRIQIEVQLPARANGTRPGFEQASLRPLP